MARPTIPYRIVTSNFEDFELFYISEYHWELSSRYSDGIWANIDAGIAARLAHMLLFDYEEVSQPYFVYHDEEREIFIVITNSTDREAVRQVVVCERTGGILLNNIISRLRISWHLEYSYVFH